MTAVTGARTRGGLAGLGGLVAAVLVALLVWWGGAGDPTAEQSAEQSVGPSTPAASATPPQASTSSLPNPGGFPVVALADLPPEAAETVELIDAGGPYPYDQDDDTFFNREGLLPDRPEGYYREYTVTTPGSPDRGARRIVAGAEGELYWTDDHYASYSLIDRGGAR